MALGVFITAGVARAEIVTVNYLGAAGNNSFGEYVYPYNVQAGIYPVENMLCDTLNRNISPGDSWTADRLKLGDLNDNNVKNLFYGVNGPGGGNATVSTYLAAAYLYNQELSAFSNNNSDPQGLYNWAVWNIFDPTDVQNKLDAGALAVVQGLMANAFSAVGNKTPGDFAFSDTTFIFTPTGEVGQEFFGPVPEPGTLVMLGTGIVGLAGVIRRKLA